MKEGEGLYQVHDIVRGKVNSLIVHEMYLTTVVTKAASGLETAGDQMSFFGLLGVKVEGTKVPWDWSLIPI